MRKPRTTRVECGKDLYARLRGHLHNSLAGKPVLLGDSLRDLVKRHCPDIYQICSAEGYQFVADTHADYLQKRPPELYFDVVREKRRIH